MDWQDGGRASAVYRGVKPAVLEDGNQQFRFGIATAEHGNNLVRWRQITLPEHKRGEGDGATGFSHQMRSHDKAPHGLANLFFADCDDVVHIAADVLEVDFADVLCAQSV